MSTRPTIRPAMEPGAAVLVTTSPTVVASTAVLFETASPTVEEFEAGRRLRSVKVWHHATHAVWPISSDVTAERDDCVSFRPTAVIDLTGHLVPTYYGMICGEIALPGVLPPNAGSAHAGSAS